MKPAFGLDDATISCIHRILGEYVEIEKAIIYGSRAKGNYRPGSDIDLALFGQLSAEIIANVLDDLEESFLPYTFDVSAFESIKNDALREHIDRVGKTFYQRTDCIPFGSPAVSTDNSGTI